MNDLPTVESDRLVYALQRAGFWIPVSDGIHTYLRRHHGQPERVITVRDHRNHFLRTDRELKRGTVRAILRAAGLTLDELRALL